jgi:large subunit ribosomal protein L6
MSRIGSKPVEIPQGVEVKIEEKGSLGGQKFIVKGPLGELENDFRKEVMGEIKDGKIHFKKVVDTKMGKSLFGLYRTLVSNMITGVTKGYEKDLEMIGIGYRAEIKGNDLEVQARATHPFMFKAPEGISFEVTDKVNIKVKGINKQLVGQVAASVRSCSKPEPYKGKGIRYKGEYVRRKAGKAAKSVEGEE